MGPQPASHEEMLGADLKVPFGALAFTLGESMEDSTVDTLQGWREELGSSCSFLVRRISVVLLQKRARMWRF
jgi:hypothetical protein